MPNQVAAPLAERPILSFTDVRTHFATDRVLDGVTFDVRRGEFICLLGPSGCGKSTSLRIAGDLLKRYDGEVLVDGRPPKEAWTKLAYVFQTPRLVAWRTALRNAMLGMELRGGQGDDEIKRRALDAMRMVGLANDLDKFPAVLSGGERQRVSIARALAVDPEIIVMDEPLSQLDVRTKLRLRDEIVRIWRETKKTVVFVTHDVDEALYLADRIVLFSAKPTVVLQIHKIGASRPRDVVNDAGLQAIKRDILEQLGMPGHPLP